jgi:hypothetical protein
LLEAGLSDDARILDLSSKTFEEFVSFFFARDVVPDDAQYAYYSFDVSLSQQFSDVVSSRPDLVLEYMTRLFSEFGQIAPKYSLAQIDQAIWGIFGENLRLYELLWDSLVPLEDRIDCIRSMYSVYSDFVSKSKEQVMANCFDMWWDMILHGFWFQPKLFKQRIEMGDASKLDSESRRLLDAMFGTLKNILELPDARTQRFALHGLGHLHHPAVRDLVQKFIDAHKTELTEEGLRWIAECRDGTVM